MLRVVAAVAFLIAVVGCSSNPPAAFDPIPAEEALALRSQALEDARSPSSPKPREGLPTDFVAMAVGDFPDPLPVKAVGELRFHSIPVGAGSCHLIECPGNTSPIIYDCGSNDETSNSFSRQQVNDYFDEILSRYDDDPIVIVSHADQDHYNLLEEAMGAMSGSSGRRASVVYLGGERTNYRQDNFESWLRKQEQRGVTVRSGLARFPPFFNNNGNPVSELQCGDADTFIMAVNAGFKTNPRSMVVRVKHGDFVVTLTGDAFKITEDASERFPGGPKTTVLTGSHHGASSNKSNHADWAGKAKPQIAIYSAGRSYKHPRCSSMLRYKNSLASVSPHRIRCGKKFGGYTKQFFVNRAEFVTEISGVITVTSSGSGFPDIECSADPGCG